MPELPDVTVYVEALAARITGRRLQRLSIRGPSVLRTFDPPADAAEGRTIAGVRRLAKRIVIELEDNLFLVVHLMIAGRFRWFDAGKPPTGIGKIEQARLTFDSGTLVLTEAGTQKRASIHLLRGRESLLALDAGGIDVLAATADQFIEALRQENHTLKRSLTDPRLFSGIGNAYSDEILHAARLSPLKLSASLTDDEAMRLHEAACGTLAHWTDTLRRQFGLVGGAPGKFPGAGQITAFRPDFAVHGKFGTPCPICAAPVQRIVYAENECNYCPRCQTGGKVLADRSMSRLLKDDWPKTIEDLAP